MSCSRSSVPPASASRGSPASSPDRCASGAAVAVGRCLSYGEGLTFWPLREVVTALAGDPDGESSHEVQSGLLRLLQDGDEAAAVVERVAGALGWSESAADPPGTFWAVRELLAAAGASSARW